MAQRSNKTAAEILALAPVNALNDGECVGWFATCLRWATIEQYEPVKETAWLGLKESDRLCKRDIYLMTLKAELQAYINVISTETIKPADLNPSEPSISSAASTQTLEWPTEGQAAQSPTLPSKEGL